MSAPTASPHFKVMVRAFADEPVELLAFGRQGSSVLVSRTENGHIIGFPEANVFRRNPSLLRRLRRALEGGRSADVSSLWRQATRYTI